MVTAISFGLTLSDLRQRAASTRSAVESGPPETASPSAGKRPRSEKSELASVAETGLDFCMGMILSENLFGIMPTQQFARFCSWVTPRFTLAEARGNLRPTSASVAQAASF